MYNISHYNLVNKKEMQKLTKTERLSTYQCYEN